VDSVIKNIVVGSVLGDGYLTKPSKKGSRLWLKYNDKSLSYLKWLHEKLMPIGVGEIKIKRGYNQHYFLTDSSLEIADLRNSFYSNGKKGIPANIQDILTDPLSLAIWYMDDGCLDYRAKYHCNSTFATFYFSYEDCGRLAETLEVNFGVKARVHECTMRGKMYYRIYILSESMNKFFDIIRKYIQPCMSYKISYSNHQQSR